ncbi:MAG: hypothetical protein RL409_2624 [Gemmatimonadota bacterium]
MRTATSGRRHAGVFALSMTALALGVSGCNSDALLTERPKDIIVADNLYTNLEGFEAGLSALYAQVRRERWGQDESNNEVLMLPMVIGTDNGFGNYVSPNERTFQEFGVRMTPTDGFITHIWNVMYQTINAANTVIARAENPAVQWTPAEKARVVAEARLIRAWSYRHLSYLFGDVPINTTESSGGNIRTDWDRAPRDSVRKFIVNDLLFAEANLPATSTNAGKATKAVAQHYLAEMYLALDQPALAEQKANAVITSGLYKLITARYGVKASQPGVAFMDQFQDGNVNRAQGNTEALWVLQYAELVNGGGGSIMRRYWVNRYEQNRGMQISPENGGRGIGRLAMTRYAIQLYEAADQRGGAFALRRFYTMNNAATLLAGKKLGDTLLTAFPVEKLSDPLWPSTRKWDWASPIDPAGGATFVDQPYLRLAETYLLLAEAQFKQGRLADAAATLNIVRARAGASAIVPSQVTLAFILDERSRELVTEEQRRYTLLRTGTWYARTVLYNPLAKLGVVPRDSLLPIPQTVIDANLTKKMTQNPGYGS